MSADHGKPTIGAAVLLSNGPGGWDPPAILLPSPLVILRFLNGRTRLFVAGSEEPFFDESGLQPLVMVEEVLFHLRRATGSGTRFPQKPAFPLAVVAAAYEFGRWFPPHQNAFHDPPGEDELFAAFFLDGYKPDTFGGTERLGFAGTVAAGWMANAPALRTSPAGHEPPAIVPHFRQEALEAAALEPSVTKADYIDRIRRIQEYLAAGDCYQVNLTVPWRGRTALDAEAIFDRAIARGGAAFAGIFLMPKGSLLSFSPELFLRRRERRLETRPIKGTRRIGLAADAPATAREELLASAKDRAEHIMIVDLERNDLGRLCEPGTVKVDPLMACVEHPTVMHLESWVAGQLHEGASLVDIFRATFPGGSVTGAPKKRSLEIIRELEREPRGWYCGAFGWIDAEGDMELNLPIRTAFLQENGELVFNAGGGIVAESDAEEEWAEMEAKAAFFRSLLEQPDAR